MKCNRGPEKAVRTAIHLKVVGLSVGVLKKMPNKELTEEIDKYTGNTRFSSAKVLAEFFRCGLIEHIAGKNLRYYCNRVGSCRSIASRMKTIQEETRDLYEAYRDFNKAGHVTQSLAWILDPARNKRGDYGRNRRNMSVRICREMVRYHKRSRIRASKKTGVPINVIRLWLNLGPKE